MSPTNTSDDDSSMGSLLVSPVQNSVTETSWSSGNQPTDMASSRNKNFKNNGQSAAADDHATDGDDDNRRSMDVTFQEFDNDEDEFDTASPAKERKFSYAAAMEQLDDSWLAPTPKQPRRRPEDGREDDLDSTMDDDDDEAEIHIGGCLEDRFSESPLKEDELLSHQEAADEDESEVTANQEDTTAAAIPPPDNPALAPAPNYSALHNVLPANKMMQSDDQDHSPPNNETNAVVDTTSAIFRHPPNHSDTLDDSQQTNSISSSNMMTLQLGHPLNESYDSVEQRKQLAEQEKRCISSFLADRDRVENDIVMTELNDGEKDEVDNADEEQVGKSELESLEEYAGDENGADTKEMELSIEEDDEDEEDIVDDEEFDKSVFGALERHVDEAELTLTQAADCTTDSDLFLKKIERTESDNVEFPQEEVDEDDCLNEEADSVDEEEKLNESVNQSLLADYVEEVNSENTAALTEEVDVQIEADSEGKKNDTNESTFESDTYSEPPAVHVQNNSSEDTKREENDAIKTAPDYLSSPSASPVEANDPQDQNSLALESSSIAGVQILEIEEANKNVPELTSSRSDSLAFSTSADTDDVLELSNSGLSTSKSSEEDGNTEKIIDSNVELNPDQASTKMDDPKDDATVEDHLDVNNMNPPPSEAHPGIDISFDDNSMSASLDVSLSNIDREALFANSFSQNLSPIRQNSSSPHGLSQHHDDDLKGDEIGLPTTSGTSLKSETSQPTATGYAKSTLSYEGIGNVDKDANVQDDLAGESLEDAHSTSSPAGEAEANKGSIFAVLSQVNSDASSDKAIQGGSLKQEEATMNKYDVMNILGYSKESNYVEDVTKDSYAMDSQSSPIKKTSNEYAVSRKSTGHDLDDKNKSLEDLSSFQQSFNSTSNAFLERLRGAAESRKREVTKARFSMERKEQILYEEKEEREIMPTLPENAEMVEDPIKRAADSEKTQLKSFKARPLPSQATERKSKPLASGSVLTVGSKRKSSNALRPHTNDNKSAISAKPPKRLLSGEAASHAREMTRKRLLQEEEERIQRDSVFRARPLPASTLPRRGLPEYQSRMSNNSKPARAGKENSAFKLTSSARAEERAAYNEEKKAREEARRQEQIRKRNALINEANAEIDNLKRFLR